MQIKEKLLVINEKLSTKNIKLIVVSKQRRPDEILQVYQCSIKDFGENKVQELMSKIDKLPADINWHFIGHLQRNKVKFIAPFIKMIHSVDSLRLLKEINKEAVKNNRTIECLLEFHIASEPSKFGLNKKSASQLLEDNTFNELKNVRICGVMGMATFTENKEQVHNEFKMLKTYFNELKATYFHNKDYFKEISMGMSDDYKIAIEEGTSMIRLGSHIFGPRKY